MVPESHPALRRVERDALIACAAIAAAAWAVARGNVQAPLGVFGGGALAWISYRGIKGGIDALTGAEGAGTGVRMAIGLVKFFTRYAILAVAAYVIMARLRLPPLAVFAGASSLVVAVAVEAVRGISMEKLEHELWIVQAVNAASAPWPRPAPRARPSQCRRTATSSPTTSRCQR